MNDKSPIIIIASNTVLNGFAAGCGFDVTNATPTIAAENPTIIMILFLIDILNKRK